jgi:hypothetical protein
MFNNNVGLLSLLFKIVFMLRVRSFEEVGATTAAFVEMVNPSHVCLTGVSPTSAE